MATKFVQLHLHRMPLLPATTPADQLCPLPCAFDHKTFFTNNRSALPESIVRQSQKTAAMDVTGPRRQQAERTAESAHAKQGPSLAPSSATAMEPG